MHYWEKDPSLFIFESHPIDYSAAASVRKIDVCYSKCSSSCRTEKTEAGTGL